MSVPRRLRPLVVVLYAAFIGLLLASYVPPLQDILQNRAEIPVLDHVVVAWDGYASLAERNWRYQEAAP